MNRSKLLRRRLASRYLTSRRQFLKKLLMAKAAILLSSCESGIDSVENTETPDDPQTVEDPETYDAVIVGGGISGLIAAYLLRDKRVLLLEKENRFGGRIVSGEWEGFSYPKGTEYIGKPEGDVAQWFDELGIEAVPVPPPTDAVFYQSRIYAGAQLFEFLETDKQRDDYVRLLAALDDYGMQGITEDALEDPLESLETFTDLDHVSVEEWMNSQSIDSLVQLFVNVENRGLFAGSNADLSLLFNIPEMIYNFTDLYDPEEYDEEAVQEEEADVYTFPRGIIEIVEALEVRLSNIVRSGVEVIGVSVNSDETATVVFKEQGQTVRVETDAVIMASSRSQVFRQILARDEASVR